MNILIIDARWHDAVADALVDGATSAMERGGAHFERLSVPGVLELPAAIALAARSANSFDGYVALGCVLGLGVTSDTLYRETIRGLTNLGLEGLVIGNGVILADDEQGALNMAVDLDAGGNAARAALALISFRERLEHLR